MEAAIKKKKKKARLKLSKRDPHEVKSQTPRECGAVGSQWGLPGPKRQDTSLTWLVTWKRNREHDLATNCPGRATTARSPPPLPAALGRHWRRAHLGIGLQRQPALTLHGRSARPLSSSDSRRRRRRRFRPRGPDLALSNLRPPGGVSEDEEKFNDTLGSLAPHRTIIQGLNFKLRNDERLKNMSQLPIAEGKRILARSTARSPHAWTLPNPRVRSRATHARSASLGPRACGRPPIPAESARGARGRADESYSSRKEPGTCPPGGLTAREWRSHAKKLHYHDTELMSWPCLLLQSGGYLYVPIQFLLTKNVKYLLWIRRCN